MFLGLSILQVTAVLLIVALSLLVYRLMFGPTPSGAK